MGAKLFLPETPILIDMKPAKMTRTRVMKKKGMKMKTVMRKKKGMMKGPAANGRVCGPGHPPPTRGYDMTGAFWGLTPPPPLSLVA